MLTHDFRFLSKKLEKINYVHRIHYKLLKRRLFFSILINLIESYPKDVFKRGYIINGNRLITQEFDFLRKYLVKGAEIIWNENFKYYLEGINLPESE